VHLTRQDSISSPVARPSRIADSLFLFLIVLLSAAPYLSRIGFYSDDWYFFLARFHNADEQTLSGFADSG